MKPITIRRGIVTTLVGTTGAFLLVYLALSIPEAVLLHLHRERTSFPPSFAFYIAFDPALRISVGFGTVLVTILSIIAGIQFWKTKKKQRITTP